MSEAVRVAAVQMNSGNDAPENRRVAGELLQRAADQGARIAVLPENFSIMAGRDEERRAVAEVDGAGPVQDFLARVAQQLRMWIVAGTTPLRRTGSDYRLATACLVYDATGQRVARYDKIHLFDVDLPDQRESYRESAHFAPGSTPVVLDTPAGRLGLSVCYDMRFPELYRALVADGAEWFTMPAAFTVPTGRAHWEPLLRARAIENLCPVVAAAQWGVHANGRGTWGHSMIIDHWGRVLAELDQGVGVISAEFDRDAQREARRTFPALTHRVL
jgi:deaminated glutathione amidase